MSKKSDNQMTPKEVETYLKDCIKIPREKWMSLPDNSQIAYYKNDGKFVKSGYIKLAYSKDGEDYIRYGSKLCQMNNDKYYREFTIKLSNIKSIYKRVSQDAIWEYHIMQVKVDRMLASFDKKITDMQERIDQNEKCSKKIVRLIKKLHKIESLNDLASC